MKKSESESESEVNVKKNDLEEILGDPAVRIRALEKRILALEKALMHAQHTNTEDGSRHQNDGGWFD